MRSARIAMVLFVLVLPAFSGTPGSFRGILLEGANTRPGWMYVQSRNDVLRLVRISGAAVSYGDDIPPNLRHEDPRKSLHPGAEVRVLAEQDGHGDWRAKQIEILRLAPMHRANK